MANLTPEEFEEKYGVSADRVLPIKGQEKRKPLSTRIAEGLGLGKAVDVFGTEIARATAPKETRGQIEPNKTGQLAGATAQTLATALSPAITGGATLMGQIGAGVGAGAIYDIGKDLAEGEKPSLGGATIAGGLVPPALKGLAKMAKFGFSSAKNFLGKGAEAIAESPLVQGAVQKGEELAERVPRGIEKVGETLQESAIKAERIRTAPPVVANALKVDLPDKYINYAQDLDAPTRKAVLQVLDIADETPTTIGVKKNPTIVGGELAGKQFDIIEKQKKAVGEQIGKEIDALGLSNVKANMGVAFNQIDDVLMQNRVSITADGKLVSDRFTDKELAVVQDLYNKARKRNPEMSAIEVRDIDNLFSKLQREAKIDGVGNIFLKANDEDINIFKMFRYIYSNQLENIAPQIRPLNAEYRKLSTLTEDIEDSIMKTPNFNVTKTQDPAEFAKVNLRRIFGEAQSSPAYEAVADQMDEVARSLGYTDAPPKEIAAFAQEIRELYPEAVPRTGFQGGFGRIMDIAEKVLGAGKADVIDQRKALRALLEENAT